MKKIFAIALSFAAISLTGCIQDKIVDRTPLAGDEIRVTSTIDGNSTRASIDAFTTGNAIGIYKLPAGAADFSMAHRENAYYTYAGEGDFAPFDETHKLFWKETAVDFVAYYPYEALAAGDFTYDIDVTEQTDFLYSDKVSNKTADDISVDFLFHHKLSKIKFEVTSEDTDIDLEGMTVVIEGMNTLAEFDLEASEWLILEDSADDITATIDGVTGTSATAHALVLPVSGYPTFDVVITLANGDTDTETFTNKNFVADKQHTYELNLTIVDEQLEIGVGGSSIDPWEDGEPGDDVTGEEGETPEPSINEGDITSTLPAGDVTAEGGDFSISYTITNPIDGEVVDPVITGDFITIAPETRATAPGTVNFIVAENTTTEPRTGSIALNYNEVTLKTITITQAAGEAEDTINWLFDGADFNGESSPASITATSGPSEFDATAGMEGGAMVIKGTTTGSNGNGFVIDLESSTAVVTKSISFMIKGTAEASFSVTINGDNQKGYNMGTLSVDKVIASLAQPAYTGTIDTNGEWVKVTMNMTSTPSQMAFRCGKSKPFDIAIDNITFE